MAVITGIATLNVGRSLAGSDHAIMTGYAGADDLRVVDGIRRGPDRIVVTVFADIRRIDMGLTLAGRRRAIVATEAVVGYSGVVENRRNPGVGRMTCIAVASAWHVRRVLAGRRCAVVAGVASSQHLRMVDRIGRCPRDIVVAVFAHIGCIDMRLVFAGRADAVMTGRTIVDDAGVIEVGRNPCRRRVTIIAIVTALDVRLSLTAGNRTVVARTTGACYLRMVDRISRRPDRVVMAVFADIARSNMCLVLAGCAGSVVTTEAIVRYPRMVEGCR